MASDLTIHGFIKVLPNRSSHLFCGPVSDFVISRTLMKTLFLISFSLAVAVAMHAAEVPEDSELKSMTERSILSFGRAVKKQDFSEFYDEIAEVWQKQTSPKKLLQSFEDFLDKKIDIPRAIEEKEPVFNHAAKINSDDVLLIKGYYPTTPNRVVFELKYLQEDDEWKLAGIDVNLTE
jgi:hypothetical protein